MTPISPIAAPLSPALAIAPDGAPSRQPGQRNSARQAHARSASSAGGNVWQPRSAEVTNSGVRPHRGRTSGQPFPALGSMRASLLELAGGIKTPGLFRTNRAAGGIHP